MIVFMHLESGLVGDVFVHKSQTYHVTDTVERDGDVGCLLSLAS